MICSNKNLQVWNETNKPALQHLASTSTSLYSGTPESSILIGFSIISHPFWGTTIFGNTYIYICIYIYIFGNQWSSLVGSPDIWAGFPGEHRELEANALLCLHQKV